MRRREFVSLLSSAAVTWPVVGHAQQRVMPVVGVLCAGTAEGLERYLASFREGMRQLGYVDGNNVRFELRFADGYLDRLPDLANELVRLNPRVIVSTPLCPRSSNSVSMTASSACGSTTSTTAPPLSPNATSPTCNWFLRRTGRQRFTTCLRARDDIKNSAPYMADRKLAEKPRRNRRG